MEDRITKYFNLAKLALVDMDSEDRCLEEFAKTVEYLTEVAKLKRDIDFRVGNAKRKFETFLSIKCDIARRNFKTKGVTYSEKMVEDTIIRMYTDEYEKLRKDYDTSKSDYEIVNNLLHIMYTRRDLVKEMINHFRFKQEKTECMMLNRNFLKKIEYLLENTR